jgi:hypothetical protein
MLGDHQFDFSAGPLPESITRAVARRRVAVRLRRAGAVGAVLMVAGVGAWFARPGQAPSAGRSMAQHDLLTDEPVATRLDSASVLALRLAGPEHATATPVANHPRANETVFGLRQREFERLPSPAS